MMSSETNQTPMWRVLQLIMLAVITSGIAACSDFQRAIGSTKSSPDEFEVVVRPPLQPRLPVLGQRAHVDVPLPQTDFVH